MKTDKAQFDEVLKRIIAKNPQKTAEIKSDKKKAQDASPKPAQK